MNWKTFALLVFTAIMMQCSFSSSPGDLSGGGVIGNPSGFSLSYTDTVRGPAKTNATINNGNIPVSLIQSETRDTASSAQVPIENDRGTEEVSDTLIIREIK